MMPFRMTPAAGAALLVPLLLVAAPARAGDDALAAALSDPARSPEFIERDAARHPREELEFFGLRPDMTVVEIFPGGGYWTEILAPYLQAHGSYYLALSPARDPQAVARDPFRAKLAADPARYGKLRFSTLGAQDQQVAPPGSADLVITFRNLHNWMKAGYADRALKGFYAALKPGGILGIEDHRGRDDRPQDPKAADGYVRQDYAVELARQAGFEFVGSSEINANPRDTKDWPAGVWTLPPSFALKDQDHDKYAAIGEADNFVLKFRKPAP